MSIKAISLIDQDQELKAIIDEIERQDGKMEAEIEFMRKRAEQIFNGYNESKQKLWDKLYELLADKRLVPEDFDRNHPHQTIGYNTAKNIVYVHKCCDQSEKTPNKQRSTEAHPSQMGEQSQIPPEGMVFNIKDLPAEMRAFMESMNPSPEGHH